MDSKYTIALNAHRQIGSRTLFKLVREIPDFATLWQNPGILAKTRLDDKQKTVVTEAIKQFDPDKEAAKLAKRGIKFVLHNEPNYPANLAEIPDLPFILYYKGELAATDNVSLAVVGSRKYSEYGARATEELTSNLAKNLIIVSGLALGIDALAHRSTIDNNGKTIAVLPCGLDQIYPAANTRLADKILEKDGAIISEFSLATPAERYNFPIRNRIIAGMTLGTLITEGAIDSGSLITTQAALTYNREVFAVPGSIFSENSAGPNRLIQMGAKLVTSAEDIFTELNISSLKEENTSKEIIADSVEEGILLKLLAEPTLIDELVKETKMAPSLVNATLIMLEMKGVVKNLGGTRYVIKGKLKP